VRASSWALELADLGRRITALEDALTTEGAPVALDPWEPPAALDTLPTPAQRQLVEELMARLDACQAGVEQAARNVASSIAEDQQRRVAARRYARP
jgi:hypothetical protein